MPIVRERTRRKVKIMVNELSTIAEQVEASRRERNPESAGLPETETAAEREARLVADNPPTVVLAGTSLPPAVVLDAHGAEVELHAVLDGRPSVIIFYRGNWCPTCNIALRSYQHQLQPFLRESGVNLVAISPQTPDNSLSTEEKHDLQFVVLSDPGNALARALGVMKPTDADIAATSRVDVRNFNADGTWDVPYPTTIITDEHGIIRFIDARIDHTTRTEPGTILNVVREVSGSGAESTSDQTAQRS